MREAVLFFNRYLTRHLLLLGKAGVPSQSPVLAALCISSLLSACSEHVDEPSISAVASHTSDAPASSAAALAAVLTSQPDDIKARYPYRHPAETLAFFGVEPGMTVVETDPGSGWYSRILAAYLGPKGTLIGADYALDMYPLFNYYDEAGLAAKATWASTWPEALRATVPVETDLLAYNLGDFPAERNASVDVFLFVRSLHNLSSYEPDGGYLTTALTEAYRALKPGGILGIVQHEAPDGHSDVWASGGNGYLKKRWVIDTVEAAGFVFAEETGINANPADQPTEQEYVWRLPPTMEPVEDPELAARYAEIGESHRMTLRFTKPE